MQNAWIVLEHMVESGAWDDDPIFGRPKTTVAAGGKPSVSDPRTTGPSQRTPTQALDVPRSGVRSQPAGSSTLQRMGHTQKSYFDDESRFDPKYRELDPKGKVRGPTAPNATAGRVPIPAATGKTVQRPNPKPQYKGSFVGQRWAPAGSSHQKRAAYQDKQTGEWRGRRIDSNPAGKGQEWVWGGSDWISPEEYAASRRK